MGCLVDAERIEGLYRQHAGVARAVAVAITGDPVLAEDLAQDAFIRCASRLGAFREPEKFRSYLLRTVMHLAASHFRRRKIEQRSLQRLAATLPRPEPPAAAETALTSELLGGLRSLPIRQRTALTARFLLDWSEHDTAEAMGCGVGTVKSLTSRGLARLRVTLADREGADHDGS
jgi:RNA polymerase sigma factor (sigma-70 family)